MYICRREGEQVQFKLSFKTFLSTHPPPLSPPSPLSLTSPPPYSLYPHLSNVKTFLAPLKS